MPRNAAGAYSLPLPPVVTGTTIAATFENSTDADIATELTNSLDRNGRGGMLAPFKIADGTVSAPGMAFTQDPDNGIYRIDVDHWGLAVASALVLDLSSLRIATPNGVATALGNGQFTIGGPAVFSGTVIFNAAVQLAGGLSTSGPNVVNVVGSTGTVAAAAGADRLRVSGASSADAAFIGFNRLGTFGAYLGIDTDNTWKVGGWSMGAVSYKLLHEGNSWAIAGAGASLDAGAKNLYTTGAIFGGDVYVSRGVGAGVLFFGTNAARYIFQDGARYEFIGHPISTDGAIGAGVGATGTVIAGTMLDAKVAANQHGVIPANQSVVTFGAMADNGSAWGTLALGALTVWPVADNTAPMGATGHRWTAVWAVTGTIQTSDARLKKNVQDSPLGLAFIEDLRPVSYQWINGGNVLTRIPDGEEVVPAYQLIDGSEVPATTRTLYKDALTPTEGKRTHYGLIAQEVRQAVAASGVVDFGGFVQTDLADPESELGLNYGEFVAPLIKAVQELSARVKNLEGAPVPTP